MVGIDLGDRDPSLRLGHRVTLEARERGAIVRPLGDVVVLMPPLSISKGDLRRLVEIVTESIEAACASIDADRGDSASSDGCANEAVADPPGRLNQAHKFWGVTDLKDARSRDVSQLLVAPATQAPQAGEIAFEALYNSSRDDVYAYAAGLLRDRVAAEDVTATAFGAPTASGLDSTPAAAAPAPGCLESPAMLPWTS